MTCVRKPSSLQLLVTSVMSEETQAAAGVNQAFLRSKRGLLKLAEIVTLLVAFVCFAAAPRYTHVTATVLEAVITALLLLLYLLNLHKKLTLFSWPLVDVFNSVFAAVYFLVLSIIAMTTYNVTATLVGGVFGLVVTALMSADGFILYQNISLNQPRRPADGQSDK
ncbi:proteolipid protein 2 [Synchiropus splendidus]|uniref:proteolipid protein 2 n=1 Tax=Synchiropus splendidus TaxID=270530 RepID=UPI00237D5861|nr:proteolipid protein 2 [Synchiropus splendidus]